MASFNIKDYEPVEVRLARFWEKYPDGSVQTELVHHTDTQFVVKSFIYSDRNNLQNSLLATGYAEEQVATQTNKVNFASALENCETSSIGRALANAGFAPKGARPSREEMDKAGRKAAVIERPNTVLDQVKQALLVFSKNADERKQFVLTALGASELGSLNDLGDNELAIVMKKLNEVNSAPFTE